MSAPLPSSTPDRATRGQSQRRGFFVGLSALGALGALASWAAAPRAGSVPAAAESQSPRTEGYHLSAHVRRYYETTRV